MTLHRKKPVLVEATQWFKNGDHPFDNSCPISPTNPDLAEGEVVRYYRTPDLDGETPCKHCSVIMHYHGWIDTLEGGHIVCPGDYIITGVQGERYPCKPDIFVATYDFWNEDSQSYEDREPCPTPEDLADIQAVHDTADEEDVPWNDIDGSDAGITWTGLAGYEAELKLEVNGQTNSVYISHLFFEALKDEWEKATLKEYGMSYAECLQKDLDNFNAGLPEVSLGFRRMEAEFKDEWVPCELPPEGWTCSRGGGHEPPCAASPTYGSHGQRKPYEKPAIIASASVAEVAKDLAGCKSAYEPHDGELTEEDHGE